MTAPTFQIPRRLFQRVGSKEREARRLAIKRRGFLFPMEHELVLENRILVQFLSHIRLAMIEMRMVVAMFVWHFEAELVEIESDDANHIKAVALIRQSVTTHCVNAEQ